MPYDGLSVFAAVNELKPTIIGTKIHKIYQPVNDEILLYFSDKDRTTLLISADPSFPRLHTATRKFDNPASPPAFCMLLRKYLLGAIVTDVIQKDFDRIILLEFETLDEAGVLKYLTLIVEIMGRHSNIILIDKESNLILDSIKHITRLKSSVREVMPRKKYLFPPNTKLSPTVSEARSGAEQLMFYRDKSAANAIVSVYMGISPQLASSILIDLALDPKENLHEYSNADIIKLAESIRDFFVSADIKRQSYIYKEQTGRYKDFSYGYYAANAQYETEAYSEFHTACEEFYAQKSISNHIKQKYEPTIKLLENLIAKEENKLLIRNRELQQAEDHEKYQIMGNLLLSNLHQIKKGSPAITLNNYYDEQQNEITIPLREDFSPSENAQMYFKKYNKGKNAITHLTKLIEHSKNELYYLQSQHHYLTHAQNAAEADEIIEELEARRIIKQKRKKKQQPKVSRPHKYLTQDEFDVLIGKNDKQNEQLTLKIAAKDDIWLHTKEIPGSHVILKTNHGTYTEESLREAAMLAAYYSKAQSSENVPIDYAYVKYVKKPKGAPTGKVIYTDYKTIYVTPNESEIKNIKKTE